jgi:hypothetical protein
MEYFLTAALAAAIFSPFAWPPIYTVIRYFRDVADQRTSRRAA